METKVNRRERNLTIRDSRSEIWGSKLMGEKAQGRGETKKSCNLLVVSRAVRVPDPVSRIPEGFSEIPGLASLIPYTTNNNKWTFIIPHRKNSRLRNPLCEFSVNKIKHK